MKMFAFLLALSVVSRDGCRKPAAKAADCFKGRLEIKGQCMNYTIKVLEGTMDTGLVMSEWKDESTGVTHNNVFRLASVCNFPTDIAEGGEFYFKVDRETGVKDCPVCMAYYPTPSKALSIAVQKGSCPEY